MSRKKRRRQNTAEHSQQAKKKSPQPEEQNANSRVFTLVALIVVCVLGAIIYSNTFDVPFLFDDNNNIAQNRHIQITKLNAEQLYDAAINSRAPRPVAYLTFAVNYYFGYYDIAGYHLVNLLIHLGNGVLVYFLASLTYRLFLGGNQGKLDESNPRMIGWLSLFAACLFVSHPLQTQAVTYIVQRMTSLSALFYLLAMLLYVEGRLSCIKKSRWLLWAGCFVAGIAALGSKQIAITLPFSIMLYEWYFFRDLNKTWAIRNLKYLSILLLVLGGVSLIFLGTSPWKHIVDGYLPRDFTMAQRLLTQPRVIMMYLGLILWPLPSRLNLMHYVSTSQSLIDPLTTLLSIFAIGGLIWLGIYLARRQRLMSFCILWFFSNLLLESSIIALEMIYEHRVYLPMFGVVLAVPYLLKSLLDKQPALAKVMAGLLILSLSMGSYQRNEVWRNAEGFWWDVIAKNDQEYRAYSCRGNQKRLVGQHDLAIADYSKAVELKPNHARSLNNRGICYMELKKHSSAFNDYAKILEDNPENAFAYANRGKLYQRMGKLKPAIKDFTRSIGIKPDFEVPYYNRAIVYGLLGQHDLAINDFNEAIRLTPRSAEAYNNRALAYRQLGQHEQALQDYDQAIAIDPGYAFAYNNRATSYKELGQLDQAIANYTKAIELMPNYTLAYQNRGTEYTELGKFDLAIADFTKATKLQPTFPQASRSLAWLLSTCPQAQLRDGQQALQYAQRACKLTNWQVPICLETLAAAHAENGQFSAAVQWQTKAKSLAPRNQNPEIQQRLELYQAGKPYRLSPSQ